MTPLPSSRNLILGRLLRICALLALPVIVLYFVALAGLASHDNWVDKTSLSDLQAQVEKNPDDAEMTFKLAHRMVGEGNSRGAFVLMQRLVKQQPNSVTYWEGYGRCAAANNDMLEAVRAYRRVLELNPRAAQAHAYLGQIEVKAGLTTEGLVEIDTARKIDPKVGINLAVWAEALVKNKRLQEAYDAIVTSISIDPTQDSLYPLFGRLAPQVGKVDNARMLLWRRVSVSAMYPTGEARSALVRLTLSQSHDAKTLAEDEELARDAVPGKVADFNAALAEVLLVKNDLRGARKTLLEGLTYGKDDPACLRLLVKIAEKQGKTAEVAQWRAKLPLEQRESAQVVALRQSVAAAPEDNTKRMALAQALYKDAEYGPAAETCLEILQRLPNDATASALLAKSREEAIHKLAQSPEVLEGKN